MHEGGIAAMSTMSDPTGTRTSEVRGTTTDTFAERRATVKETKPSFLTTEFWLMVGGIAALIVTYNVADDPSLDLWRTCLLCALVGSAYIVSRGLAKSGTVRRDVEDREMHRH
jgi:hypothetical protein